MLERTTDDYVQAFRLVIQEGIPEKHTALLQAHADAPGHTASWRQLAEVVGYAARQSVHRHYGTLAKRVGKALGISELPRDMYWLDIIADGRDRDEVGHRRFVLRQPVVDAAVQLGLIQGV
jgi:hypothetical protein